MALRMLARVGRAATMTAGRQTSVAAAQPARWISADAKQNLDNLVSTNDIVVFMKGSPDAPQCGFSRTVCVVLDMHGVKKFVSKDVLSDASLRDDIKEYSEWPTVPQVYIAGEFVGGCDIIVDMHNNGELVDALKSVGHDSTWSAESDKAASSPMQQGAATAAWPCSDGHACTAMGAGRWAQAAAACA
eukprot:CAMPEP_0182927742 /NCGR_PEP_ID=MMETSP0105_2-20130417/14048_1 /TAXON_ID=81532 ORGANISM="Acanthoeca-like sp., Strain 10tr" /NCGR_SAMPLE_ID=MMETSP0105_2 /ASSEMBLY_ACC=CAM_ASM_000205 /LENGTH=187 /DNA_ID=CAMNT_0025065709 /DNA_START=48 /DNA_END=613 /DNA_ORIENTATION=+